MEGRTVGTSGAIMLLLLILIGPVLMLIVLNLRDVSSGVGIADASLRRTRMEVAKTTACEEVKSMSADVYRY